ncbi:hypothetical protein N9159_00080 [bacterium]|jgi:hypothetical protein|nr:hypothetical protein [bacterium]|tara:strand:- start:865 stop:1320 length:456 start_codon:yes stop_codon:yes gene_type:complete
MLNEGRKAPDMGMPSQAGNNLLYALVLKAKTERELLSMIDKLALKMGGKYKDAKDELITRAAVEFFQGKGNKGEQGKPDRNVYVQVKGAADLVGGGTIKLDDKSSVKLSKQSAERVIKNLEKQKPAQRLQVQKAMSKNKASFNKFVKILDV